MKRLWKWCSKHRDLGKVITLILATVGAAGAFAALTNKGGVNWVSSIWSPCLMMAINAIVIVDLVLVRKRTTLMKSIVEWRLRHSILVLAMELVLIAGASGIFSVWAVKGGKIWFGSPWPLALIIGGSWLANATALGQLGRKHPVDPPGGLIIEALTVLRWLFGRKSREILDLVAADLLRDIQQMSSAGLPPWYIRLCVLWGALRSIVPILWHGVMTLLKNVAGAAKLIRAIIGRK